MKDILYGFLIGLFIILAVIQLNYKDETNNYINSPYTTPYMMETISPWATYGCINRPTSYTVNGTWALT